MTLKPIAVEISVEREAPPTEEHSGRRVRVTARLEPDASGVLPTPEELHAAMEALTERLDRALDLAGTPAVPGRFTDRPLQELIEMYRPRQIELVELLHEEGELSAPEYQRLQTYLASAAGSIGPSSPVSPSAPARAPSTPDRGGTAPPTDRNLPISRPIPDLIATYRIESLKQAGAVRARRQISYAEYMALKRHFSESASGKDAPSP